MNFFINIKKSEIISKNIISVNELNIECTCFILFLYLMIKKKGLQVFLLMYKKYFFPKYICLSHSYLWWKHKWKFFPSFTSRLLWLFVYGDFAMSYILLILKVSIINKKYISNFLHCISYITLFIFETWADLLEFFYF